MTDKQRKYGDSIGRSVKLLETLWPEGIDVTEYGHALLVVRIFDKLSRIATNEADDEERIDAWRDLAGYGLLGWARLLEGDEDAEA